MVAMSYHSPEETMKLFSKLKGSNEQISFEDLCENIAKTPEMFEQFRRDYFHNDGRPSYTRFEYSDMQDFKDSLEKENPIDFLKSPLSQTIKVLGYSVPEDCEVGEELCILEDSIENLYSKCSNGQVTELKPVGIACKNMMNIIKQLVELQESIRLNLQGEILELQHSYDNLKRFSEHLQEQNAEILDELSQLEKKTEAERKIATDLKQKMQRELQNHVQESYSIQREILVKERSISELKSELQSLRSKQYVREIRDSIDSLSYEQINQVKQEKDSIRKSWNGLAQGKDRNDPAFRIQYLVSQIEMKNQTIARLHKDIESLNADRKRIRLDTEKHAKRIEKLENNLKEAKNENQRLFMSLEESKRLNVNMRHEFERFSEKSIGPNLFEEFMANGYELRNTYTKVNEDGQVLMKDQENQCDFSLKREDCCSIF